MPAVWYCPLGGVIAGDLLSSVFMTALHSSPDNRQLNMAMAAAHKWCSLFFERKIMQHFQNLVYGNKYGKYFLCAFSF
jgi:hypothetical protein